MEQLRDFLVKRPPFVLAFATSIVIGNSFYALLHSLVYDIVLPVISMIFRSNKWTTWMVGPMKVGEFLGELIEFSLMFLFVYLIITWLVNHVVHTGTSPDTSNDLDDPDLIDDDLLDIDTT